MAVAEREVAGATGTTVPARGFDAGPVTNTGVAVGVGATTPASIRGRSRTTVSRVESGVGWGMRARSALVERDPQPQAVHVRDTSANAVASERTAMWV